METGIDRILFSVDYPFVDNPPATKWTETLPLCAEDKEKLLSGNANGCSSCRTPRRMTG